MEYNQENYSFWVKIERLSFNIAWILLARYTPPVFNFWRRLILQIWGAKIANRAKVYGSVKVWLPRNLQMFEGSCLGPNVDCYNIAPVIIGAGSIVSQRTFLCTASHAYWRKDFPLTSAQIEIGNNTWISAECFIGPGVVIKDNSVYFARSYVTKKNSTPSNQRITN